MYSSLNIFHIEKTYERSNGPTTIPSIPNIGTPMNIPIRVINGWSFPIFLLNAGLKKLSIVEINNPQIKIPIPEYKFPKDNMIIPAGIQINAIPTIGRKAATNPMNPQKSAPGILKIVKPIAKRIPCISATAPVLKIVAWATLFASSNNFCACFLLKGIHERAFVFNPSQEINK